MTQNGPGPKRTPPWLVWVVSMGVLALVLGLYFWDAFFSP